MSLSGTGTLNAVLKQSFCSTCRHWNTDDSPAIDGGSRFYKIGECRRFPPQAANGNPDQKGWPLVLHDHWCGEWKIIDQDVFEEWARIQRIVHGKKVALPRPPFAA